MAIKIYNVGLNSIHLSSGGPVGPGFYIDTVRTFANYYPAIGDWSSSAVSQIKVNMGQDEFVGNPMGFQPYDTSYSDTKWFGEGTASGNIVTPNNLQYMLYDKQYTSGKYYFEVEAIETNVTALGMHDGGEGTYNTSTFRSRSVAVGHYLNRAITWLGDSNDSSDSEWTGTEDGAGFGNGDMLQVFLDFDNQNCCIRKIGATIDQYSNYREFYL